MKEVEAAAAMSEFREMLIRELVSKVVAPGGFGADDVWLSSGDELEPDITSPPSLLRGGGQSDDSDTGPRGPRIIAHEVLSGPARIQIKRLEQATEEESERATNMETVSGDSAPHSTHRDEVVDIYNDSSEEERARSKPGLSKPRKRARGRPRKDGTGPFRPVTRTIQEVIDRAFDGEVVPLRAEDLVPYADKARIRRGEALSPPPRDKMVRRVG